MAAATKVVEVSDTAEDVQELLDDVVELMDDVVELMEDRVSWIKTTNAKLILVGALAVAFGAGASYLMTVRKLEKKYQTIADEQVASVKARYSVIHKSADSLTELAQRYTDEELAEKKLAEGEVEVYESMVREEDYISYDNISPAGDADEDSESTVVEEEQEIVHHNIFESDDPETYFDFEEELERRATKPNEPHVITKEEFDVNESDFDQQRLVYFDGDDVLADSADQPITDIENVVGYINLLRFGHGSGDRNVVYIRCPTLELDFEMVRSEGKFAKEILGFDDGELSHSQRRPLRKFRSSDE